MNTVIASLFVLGALGGSAAIAAECTDLAGQGTLCHEVAADPNSGVDADVTLVLEPQLPPLPPPPTAAAADDCTDLAGQGYACVTQSGTGVEVEVYVAPALPPPPA